MTHNHRPLRHSVPPAVTPLSRGVIGRTVVALAAFMAMTLFALPLMAAGSPLRLRGDVTARGDTLSLGDLVEGAPSELAARPLFRAPALGAIGTIQARRIIESVATLGLTGIETGGRVQVTVQRAARRVDRRRSRRR